MWRLTAVKQHIKLIWLYFKLNLCASMEYRTSFLTQTFGMILNNASFIFFWKIMFNNVGPIAGYNFNDVMFIWGLTSSAFGFGNIIFGNCQGISRIIINGELDTFLLQPKDVYLSVLCSKTAVPAWGDFFYGFILLFIIYGLDVQKFLFFTAFVIASGILYASLFAMVEALTFFLGNAQGLSRIAMELFITFSIYPDKIFPTGMRWLFYSILPTGFLIFIPLKIFKSKNFYWILLLLAIDIIYIIIGYCFFQTGLKKYESGNLITTRM